MPRPFPWEKSYPPGLAWDLPLAPATLPSLLDRTVARTPDATAIVYRGRSISYGELAERVDRFAAALARHGIGPDDAVGLYLPNSPWHPIAFFATLRLGARVVHLSPLDAEHELAHKLTDSGARILVTLDVGRFAEIAARLADKGALDRAIVGEESAWAPSEARFAAHPALVSAAEFLRGAVVPGVWPEVDPNRPALLQYTGGTTGTPKGAVLTHANLSAAVAIYDAWYLPQGLSHPGEDRIVCALPLFHIFALTTILLRHIANGNTIFLHQRFDVEAVLADIEAGRAAMFPGVPTMWIALTNHPGIETRDLSSLRNCSSGGASLPVEVAARFTELTGLPLRGGWGMTETAPAGTNIPLAAEPRPGTIGLPMPGIEMDVVALDDPRRVLPPGQPGELRIRGPNVTAGYWNRPEETASAFVDGWLLTGDIGHMDEDGWFFIHDRKKDMIISSGFNVYPQMIEQAIYAHPAVAEVLVVGVPDAYRGEAAKAFVSLRPGAERFTLEELNAFLADRLGRHELPAALEFREALPRTPVGKLSKIDLRRAAWGKPPATPGA